MSVIKSHRDRIVWQKGMDLAEVVYKLTATFPRPESYRLDNQITRAAISIAANIAEGHARSTTRDYANFVAIAKGSLMETETFLTLAIRLRYTSEQQCLQLLNLITEISKMLTVLRIRLLSN